MAQLSTISRFEVSGEILNEDILSILALREAGVPGAEMDKAEEADFFTAWNKLRDQWQSIRTEVSTFNAERLRDRWIKPILESMGHGLAAQKTYPILPNGLSVPINYRNQNIPIWLTDFGDQLDIRPTEGKRRRSKHELFQEYLDLTDDDWGILCTGRTIRLLTDYHKTLTRNFVEADLESIFDELDVDAFRIVWRLFRATAFVPGARGVLPIERIRDHARSQGTEIGKELRKQVVEAVVTLANGFLSADSDGQLRRSVEDDSDGPMLLYQAVLRIVYRLLFLLYVENKPGWTPAQDPRWASGYSVSRLRTLAEDKGSYRAEGEDLWEGLKVTFGIIRNGSNLFNESIAPYGGELFDDDRLWHLRHSPLPNEALLTALYLLTIFEKREKKVSMVHRVNFRNLRIDALGSVYESLLEEKPTIASDGVFAFVKKAGKGNQRKETGSYYTPPALVSELIKSALLPVIEDRLQDKKTPEEQKQAILEISVLDPACGSGAFLIQALDALTDALLNVDLGDEQPSELQLREARRLVAIHCIYGVDMNPMAVELCKFTLWLHVAHPMFPLSYLEPVIRCGNALIGVPTRAQISEAKRQLAVEMEELLAQGKASASKLAYVGWEGFEFDATTRTKVPDEAFEPVGDDLKTFASTVRDRNASERAGQLRLTDGMQEDFVSVRLQVYQQMQEIQEVDPKSISEKQRRFNLYLRSGAYQLPKRYADAWCSTFFWPLRPDDTEPPTQAQLHRLHPARQRASEPTPHDLELVERIEKIAASLRFFHWDIEFPHIFSNGGFNVVIGNPPWKKTELQEREWFAGKNESVVNAPTKTERSRLIEQLRHSDPRLYEQFAIASHSQAARAKFLKRSSRFPLAGKGKMNLYALFAESNRGLARSDGRAALICPTGIATDDTTKDLFARIVTAGELSSLFDFENREKYFDILAHSRFSLFTIDRKGGSVTDARFLLTNVSQLGDPEREIRLTPVDFELFNPNTNTTPVLRTRQDAELLRFLYERNPVLVDEKAPLNLWRVEYQQGHLNMSTDSDLFHDRLEKDDLPLFEAKMFHQFDHRWATFAPLPAGQESQADEDDDVNDDEQETESATESRARRCTIAEKSDPSYLPAPRHWVSASDAIKNMVGLSKQERKTFDSMSPAEVTRMLAPRCPKWNIAFRNITNVANMRAAIFCILPAVPCGNSAPILVASGNSSQDLILVAVLSSLVGEFVLRCKLGGTNLNKFYVYQLLVVDPTRIPAEIAKRIAALSLQLSYTSWHLKSLADSGAEPHVWSEEERPLLKAEIDALVARLFGLTRKQLRYVLDPHGLSQKELADLLDPWEEPSCSMPHLVPDVPASSFPGETFRLLKEREDKRYGEYQTRRLVLEAWERLEKELGPVEALPIRFGPNAPRKAERMASELDTSLLIDVPVSSGLFADPVN